MSFNWRKKVRKKQQRRRQEQLKHQERMRKLMKRHSGNRISCR